MPTLIVAAPVYRRSEEAIRRFAGDHIDRAVFYPEDDRFLVARDEHVEHYQVPLALAQV
jgi:hypothetical protein